MKSPAVRVAVALVVLTLAWQGWLFWQARAKVPADLAAYVSDRGTVDLVVTLRFPPERFHVLMFQRFGRVVGTEGRAVELRGVPLGRVREIARFYWVERIVPAPPERP
ncbi:MAG: hypothetical protein QN141_05630 [Armatimonadota bacterium]|nr:hypothetical protein [Armatimonadota bacterium]MDR7452692.1 hypothetical protein [Armatimonadota bacterium]MDR7466702.1 hypothetical protein [Armatimonadota bacterium]MDR7492824.1 hypothetical protein [Armatimonadota bacterium]MDR7498600.1 hypothetical protein [Armatimonadota bacterium]